MMQQNSTSPENQEPKEPLHIRSLQRRHLQTTITRRELLRASARQRAQATETAATESTAQQESVMPRHLDVASTGNNFALQLAEFRGERALTPPPGAIPLLNLDGNEEGVELNLSTAVFEDENVDPFNQSINTPPNVPRARMAAEIEDSSLRRLSVFQPLAGRMRPKKRFGSQPEQQPLAEGEIDSASLSAN